MLDERTANGNVCITLQLLVRHYLLAAWQIVGEKCQKSQNGGIQNPPPTPQGLGPFMEDFETSVVTIPEYSLPELELLIDYFWCGGLCVEITSVSRWIPSR